MNKDTIIAVYQDCFLCGSPDEKGKKMLESIAKSGKEFRKVSFATSEGNVLCAKALDKGVRGMPFFTDGTNFSMNYEDLLKFKASKPKKGTK